MWLPHFFCNSVANVVRNFRLKVLKARFKQFRIIIRNVQQFRKFDTGVDLTKLAQGHTTRHSTLIVLTLQRVGHCCNWTYVTVVIITSLSFMASFCIIMKRALLPVIDISSSWEIEPSPFKPSIVFLAFSLAFKPSSLSSSSLLTIFSTSFSLSLSLLLDGKLKYLYKRKCY